jgi:outer membrane immunogenic protein
MKSVFALLAAAFMFLAMPANAETPKWTGVYGGGHIGMDLSSTDVSVPGLASVDGLSGNGFGYGLRAGFDYQVPGTGFVVGVGGEYTWSDSDFKVTVTGLPTVLRAGIDESWSVYGRVGYDMGRVMPYLLAGYTEAEASASILGTKVGSVTLDGWIVGGGVEMALGAGFYLGAEYRYTMFDTEKVIPTVLHIDTDRHEIRAAVTYKFNPF